MWGWSGVRGKGGEIETGRQTDYKLAVNARVGKDGKRMLR